MISILTLFALIPLFIHDRYILHLIILCFIWSVVASNYSLILGYAGVFSLAQVTFFSIGSYTSGMLAVLLGVSPWIGLFAGGGVAILASLIIGLPSLRLRGIYVILLTFAFNEIVRVLLTYPNIDFITGGPDGLILPSYEIGPIIMTLSNKIPSYYIAFAIFLFSSFTGYKIIKSPIGLAFVAMRDSEVYSRCRGINPYKYKMQAFIITSFFSGLIGAFYGHYIHSISPQMFGFGTLILVIAMLVVGGYKRFEGGILGAFIMIFLIEFLRPTGLFRFVILGAFIVVILLLTPSGMIKGIDLARERLGLAERK